MTKEHYIEMTNNAHRHAVNVGENVSDLIYKAYILGYEKAFNRKLNFRKANPGDIIENNIVYLIGDDNVIYRKIISEVLRPNDMFKAFVADDGCRYGLEGLMIIT